MKVKLTSPLPDGPITHPAGAVLDVSTETGQQLIAAGHTLMPDNIPDKKDPALYAAGTNCQPTQPAAAPRSAVPPTPPQPVRKSGE